MRLQLLVYTCGTVGVREHCTQRPWQAVAQNLSKVLRIACMIYPAFSLESTSTAIPPLFIRTTTCWCLPDPTPEKMDKSGRDNRANQLNPNNPNYQVRHITAL